jgi:hypothetical protein
MADTAVPAASPPGSLPGELWLLDWLLAPTGPSCVSPAAGAPASTREQRAWTAAATSAAAGHRCRSHADNRDPATRGLALGRYGGCWCGAPQGHDWVDKNTGAPHPRPARQGAET